ncbi:MAG: nitrous oxide reductase family maturation protein NosD [Candidatus Eisenbacteria bacterium]|nr:nitrous oxide reductase family maturation protein NosD [Candidatus Eisenbacteria bacterium]MCC7141566.1 nitrous oxide reductase family maturation protein NosD [Candidatus Eisenbacteria bacterium]
MASGSSLAEAVTAAPPGATLLLSPGSHAGPVVIDRPLTIWGPREAIICSLGQGTTIDVESSEVHLLGFSVEGSGDRFEDTDAAIHLRGDDSSVEGVRITRALFGVAVSGARRVRIVGNEIVGSGVRNFGLRGDAIRLWEVRNAIVARNRVVSARDIVVWYSPDNEISGNFVEYGRYGTHFMYSSRNAVRHNTYLNNLVGIFVMYCDDFELSGNLVASADPNDGMGIGLKEAGDVTATGNRIVRCPTGVFIDTSPIQVSHLNRFVANSVEFCDTGVLFHSSEKQNEFTDNGFRGCVTAVRVDGHGDATRVSWRGNYFEDYAGFDLDRDGTGDVAHEPRSLAGHLTSTREVFRFFRGTPALGLLNVVSRILPVLTPAVVFSDPTPRLHRPLPPEAGSGP